MHEVALAKALLGLLDRHAPPGSRVAAAHVRAGPLRAIDPDAVLRAWAAVAGPTRYAGTTLEWTRLPWQLRCAACGRRWEGADPLADCACGAPGLPSGGDELVLDALDVSDPDGGAP